MRAEPRRHLARPRLAPPEPPPGGVRVRVDRPPGDGPYPLPAGGRAGAGAHHAGPAVLRRRRRRQRTLRGGGGRGVRGGGAGLRALFVWEHGPLRVFDERGPQEESRRLLSEIVAGRHARYPEVDLRHEVVAGHPVQVLTEAAEHALGLVVGTRGRGGFAGMLLGSVSQGVLHHARCPVIAVPTHG
ncbi:universal stress protein [Streptomyces sp. SID69]|uniref:universal stress protein n=1 Tax=Streptomyces sp. SID69 TaxID=2690323 RepID=UPI0031FED34C